MIPDPLSYQDQAVSLDKTCNSDPDVTLVGTGEVFPWYRRGL